MIAWIDYVIGLLNDAIGYVDFMKAELSTSANDDIYYNTEIARFRALITQFEWFKRVVSLWTDSGDTHE